MYLRKAIVKVHFMPFISISGRFCKAVSGETRGVRLGLIVLLMCSFSSTAAAQSQKGSASLSEKAQKVTEIFQDRCHVCHDVDSDRVKPLGPSLDGLFRRDKLVTGKPVTKENVKEVIKMGPTPGMPAFRYTLSDQDIDALIEYLRNKTD